MKHQFRFFFMSCALVIGAYRSDAASLRVAAEWEPAVGVVISWPLAIPDDMVQHLASQVDLYVTVDKNDSSAEQQAQTALTGLGIPASRIHFVPTYYGRFGYPYSRDWGSSALFNEQNSCSLVDARYLGYRREGLQSNGRWVPAYKRTIPDYEPEDNTPGDIAHALQMERIELPVAMTGGNIEFDGIGTAFSAQVMLDENLQIWGVDEPTFRDVLREKLGVTQYNVLPNWSVSPDLQHTDCLLKLLDPERILVKRAPQGHPDYQPIENVVKTLSQLTTPYGHPYTILRIDTPRYQGNNLANYTNVLFLNHTVYVPMFGISADQQALATWKAAMPGWDVLGFLPLKNFPWFSSDSIHCRTRAIWQGCVKTTPAN
jgi:agmatine/peptidylarginine deiminase